MGGPDFGSPPSTPPGWPDGLPGQLPGNGEPGMHASTQPYGEQRYADAPPGYRPDPPDPYRDAGPRHRRRFTGRAVAITAVAVIVAAAGAAVAVLRLSPAHGHGSTAGNSGSASASAQPPAITKAEAEQVVAHYTQVNNEANQQYSDPLLESIEGGSSYTMDSGTYQFIMNESPPYHWPAFGPVRTVYYIPSQSVHAPYPHWFVAEVTDAQLSSPQKQTGTGYIVFSQASAKAPWLDVSEPFLVPGGTPAPKIATNKQGNATAVSPSGDAAALSIAPGQIGPMTATAMDNQGAAAIKLPSNLSKLTDQNDVAFWKTRLPAGSTDSLTHQAGSGPVFGLRTTGGGAILFYYLNAQLSLLPPASVGYFYIYISGFYSNDVPLASAQVPYIDQFAAYDPPKGHSGAYITADTSGYA